MGSSIAITAILGVIVVLTLPQLVPLLDLSMTEYGVLAGLTVYAVPQVLAATLPVSTQLGTLVKLVRVLMLGPVVLLSIIAQRSAAGDEPGLSPGRLVPWFITGFLGLAVLRSLDLIAEPVLQVCSRQRCSSPSFPWRRWASASICGCSAASAGG